MIRIMPKSARAELDFRILGERFPEASQRVQSLGMLDLAEVGIDWNLTVLQPYKSGRGLIYLLGEHDRLSGRIRDVGHNQAGIEVFNPALIGTNGFYNDNIIRNLSEAVAYAAKLEILNDVEILPQGEIARSSGASNPRGHVDSDDSQYRAFAYELLARSRRIVVTRVGRDFGDYIVTEMPSGFFVAYNTNYGEAPYITLDICTLMKDKQTIRENKDAIVFRRDRRGNWAERILEEVK